ncbi:MAG: hypothetical protein AAF403_00915 [Pseudomonadota bacterium]
MTWYNSSFKQRKPIAVDASATGSGSTENKDIEIVIPNDWDLFWDNIRSDMFDVVIANNSGDQLTFKRKSGADFSTRSLTLQVSQVSTKTQAINRLFLYFQNPNQTSDLSGSFDPSGLIFGTIDLSRPSAFLVSQPLQRPPSTEPQTAFVKAPSDEIDIYFATSGLFNIRANPFNDRLGLEGVKYVNIFSFDSSGSNDTGRYDETKTRFINGFVRARAKGGSNNVDYALVCRIVTTNLQQIDIRCLIQVRDQLPS